jgi:transposase-like protein
MESHDDLRLLRCPKGHIVGILCPHCRSGLLRNEKTTAELAEMVCDSCGGRRTISGGNG